MALFTPDTVGNINDLNDIKKIREYLYRLNEQLQYVLRNLTPEDNDADGVPSLSYATGETVKVIVDGKEMDIVLAAEVIKAINESVETAKIRSNRLNINGVASAGDKFVISDLGVPSLDSATITGADVLNSAISGGTVTDAAISLSDISGGTVDGAAITGGTMSQTAVSDATMATTDHQSGKVGPFDIDSSGIDGTNVSIPATGEAELKELKLADQFWNGQTVTQIVKTIWDAVFPV